MSPGEIVVHTAAMWFGLVAAMFGLAFWIAAFANQRTNSLVQNVYAATLLVGAIYLLVYAFTGSPPY